MTVRYSLVALFTFVTLANAGAAPEVSNSPVNVAQRATFNKTVFGYVDFSSKNGSVLVDVKIRTLPDFGGPFMYHIHEKPVPFSGNCSGTLNHFNPYQGKLNAPTAAEHEVGDLSGKHGMMTGTSFSTAYIDPYLSLNPADPAYFGGLSVVVHFNNSTRIACGNITERAVLNSGGSAKLASANLVWVPMAAGIVALLLWDGN